MCKFKSSQKHKSSPFGKFLESFYSMNRDLSIVDVRFIILELMPAA